MDVALMATCMLPDNRCMKHACHMHNILSRDLFSLWPSWGPHTFYTVGLFLD